MAINKKNYHTYGPFKVWTIENFPFIETDFDAITNYQLYSKIVEHMRKLQANQNILQEANNELIQAYNSLEAYVNDYFDNLDVQEEINNKLDNMAESGQLTDIIAQYLQLAGILAYNTIEELSEASNIVEGSICRTLGKDLYNDGKGAFYKIREIINTDVVDGFYLVALESDEDLVAERIVSDTTKEINYLVSREIDIKLLGAKGDGTTDDTEVFEDALDMLSEDGGVLLIPQGTYIIDKILNVPSNVTIKGIGNAIIKASDDFDTDNPSPTYKSMFRLKNMPMDTTEEGAEVNVSFENLTIDNNGQTNAAKDGAIQTRGLTGGLFNNLNIKISGNNCWGIILFSANKNILINKCNISNNSEDNSLGGCLWVRSGLAANGSDGRFTYDVNVTNCLFTSTAKDELVCFADGIAGGHTEVNISNCTLIGKATTTYASFGLVLNCIGDNTSYLRSNVSNITILGKYRNFAIVSGYDGINESCTDLTIEGLNIDISEGEGIRSYYRDQIYNNCNIKVDYNTFKQAVNKATIKNSKLNSICSNSNVDNCIIKIDYVGTACEGCPMVTNNIIETLGYGVKTSGANSTKVLNNIIKSARTAIYLQASNNVGSADSIIANNMLSRHVNTSNTGTKGIEAQYSTHLISCNNIIVGVAGNTAGEYYGFQYSEDYANATDKVTANNNIKYLSA